MYGAPHPAACRCGMSGAARRTIPALLSLKCIFETSGAWPKQERRLHCSARAFRLAHRAISRRQSVRACRAVAAITSNCLRPQRAPPQRVWACSIDIIAAECGDTEPTTYRLAMFRNLLAAKNPLPRRRRARRLLRRHAAIAMHARQAAAIAVHDVRSDPEEKPRFNRSRG